MKTVVYFPGREIAGKGKGMVKWAGYYLVALHASRKINEVVPDLRARSIIAY